NQAYLVILSQQGPDKVCLRVVSRDVGHRMIAYHEMDATAPVQLGIPALNEPCNFVVLLHGAEDRVFELPNLIQSRVCMNLDPRDEVFDALVFGSNDFTTKCLWLVWIQEGTAFVATGVWSGQKYALQWVPTISQCGTLRQVQLHAVSTEEHVE